MRAAPLCEVQRVHGSSRCNARETSFLPPDPKKTWQHRVNSKAKLEQFLASDIQLCECDVLVGRDGRVIMAHPPETTSDLTFEEHARQMIAAGRAVKYDFKDPNAVAPAVEILRKLKPDADKVMFNADVTRGPGGDIPAVGLIYMKLCRRAFPRSIISLGATTGAAPVRKPYSPQEREDLKKAAREIGGPVTFALKADCVLGDTSVVEELLAEPNWSVTIWNSRLSSFSPNSQNLEKFRNLVRRGYVDMIDWFGKPVR
jgi:hypothetical protein